VAAAHSSPVRQNSDRRVIFFLIISLACLGSFNAFYARYGFRDDVARFSLQNMLNGSANRPFVYRQLVPFAAGMIVDALPARVVSGPVGMLRQLDAESHYLPGPQLFPDDRLTAKYYLVYYLTLGAFIGAICVLYRVCLYYTSDPAAAILASIFFALSFPLYMTVGGYFYDYWELLFFSLAFLIAIRGNLYLLPLLAIPATLNKESFLLFLPMLIPLLRARAGWRKALLSVGSAAVVSAALNLLVKHHYAANHGGALEWHLPGNLVFWFSLWPLLRLGTIYGVPVPRGFNVVNLLLLIWLIRSAGRDLPPSLRQSSLVGAAISLPLFLMFCYQDELRNLSMLYVPFTILIAFATVRALRSPATARQPGQARHA
jgi:hypothetical protein